MSALGRLGLQSLLCCHQQFSQTLRSAACLGAVNGYSTVRFHLPKSTHHTGSLIIISSLDFTGGSGKRIGAVEREISTGRSLVPDYRKSSVNTFDTYEVALCRVLINHLALGEMVATGCGPNACPVHATFMTWVHVSTAVPCHITVPVHGTHVSSDILPPDTSICPGSCIGPPHSHVASAMVV